MPTKYLVIFQYILAFLTLLATSLTLYTFFRNDSNYFMYGVILTGLFSCYFVWKYSVVKKRYQDKLSLCARNSHAFNHEIRNAIHEIEENVDTYIENPELLGKMVKKTCINCIDLLSECLSGIVNKEVCVHIKHIPFKNESNNQDNNEIALKNFCSCKNTRKLNERHTTNTHLVKNNVPYQHLFGKKRGHTYYPRFRKTAKTYNKNKGTNELFITANTMVDKYYGSVAQVPIRLEKSSDEYDIRGIIIADYKKKNTFKEKDENLITDIMKIFADGLYDYFLKFENLQNEIKKRIV